MARGSSIATQAATTGQNLADSYSGNASSLFSSLEPQLNTEATNPQGFAPTDLAAMNTSAQQSAGGTQAAAVGQGALRSARTRNAGGADAAIGEASRHAGEQLSNAGLTTTLKNASLRNEQQQHGISGLNSLFGENASAGNQALGDVAPNVNADTNAENASWDWSKDLFQPLLAAASSSYRGGK